MQLLSLANEQTLFLPVDAVAGWSNTSFTSTPITLMTTSSSGFPIGHALVTVFTNGIPSQSKFIVGAAATPVPTYGYRHSNGNRYADLNADRHTHGDDNAASNSYCDRHGHRHANTNSYCDCYGYRHANANGHCNSHRYRYANSNSDSHCHGYRHANPNSYSYRYRYADSNSHCDGYGY